jgi:sucrose phosphorylase
MQMPGEILGRMRAKLAFLYGEHRTPALLDELARRLEAFEPPPAPPGERLSEQDVIVITYGDIVQRDGEAPLRTLHEVLARYLGDVVSGVHILPFFPYSSDDGFSVIDYTAVNPDFGGWADVARLGADFRLMFDAVINHISAGSEWFQGFLRWDAPYRDYFITVPPDADLSMVVRPRALPLLTRFDTAGGEKLVWTTFSTDQIDLDYHSPDVLFEIIDVLLHYVKHGAHFIRMDAIAYLWKEIGSSCIHLPETHTIVKLFRDVLDAVAPWVMIITETNVPHEENVSYFGSGRDEAQLVYNFTLPPLTLHTLVTGDARKLSAWARTLEAHSDETTFFNFTASHDGIGVRPVEGILTRAEVQALVDRTQAHGGNVSFKTNADGTKSPYELNVTYFDALSDPEGGEPPVLQARRFIVSQAIQLAMQGVPGIYFHNLFGSRNWNAGVAQTGHLRTINREKLQADELIQTLNDPGSLRAMVYTRYTNLLRVRRSTPAFHPRAAQRVLDLGPAVFALVRTQAGSVPVLALHNVTAKAVDLSLNPDTLDIPPGPLRDLLTGETHSIEGGRVAVRLAPYGVCWLQPL